MLQPFDHRTMPKEELFEEDIEKIICPIKVVLYNIDVTAH